MNHSKQSNNNNSKEHTNKEISSENPVIMIFLLSEFETTFGKLEMEIPNKIYNCPFYIYDESLDKFDLKFENELEINDTETQIGFDILDKIWLHYVSKAQEASISKLFQKKEITKQRYLIKPEYGFIPGYDLLDAKKEAKKNNFNVLQWNAYWQI